MITYGHIRNLEQIAGNPALSPTERLQLLNAAHELRIVSRLACDRRDQLQRQIELRVEAQMRAARLARDSRR